MVHTKGWDGLEKIEYLNFCEEIITNENLYYSFKQNSKYTPILEHISFQLATAYYNLLEDEYKKLIPLAYKVNDVVGQPILFETPEGLISGTTLRYLKVLQDLDNKNILNGNIVEIGAGYGGQARLILALSKHKRSITSYLTVDLRGPSLLQAKYNKDIKKFRSVDFDELEKQTPNLVISNYAFSELTKDIQQIYLDKVIHPSNSGYLTYNPGAGWEFSVDEICQILTSKKVQKEPDSPMEIFGFTENCILHWK